MGNLLAKCGLWWKKEPVQTVVVNDVISKDKESQYNKMMLEILTRRLWALNFQLSEKLGPMYKHPSCRKPPGLADEYNCIDHDEEVADFTKRTLAWFP